MGVLGSVVIGLYLLNLLMWIYLFLVLVGGFFLGVIWGVIVGYFKDFCFILFFDFGWIYGYNLLIVKFVGNIFKLFNVKEFILDRGCC